MPRDHKLSFVIPRRKSSIQALRPDPNEPAPSPSASSSHHQRSNNAKAHKILGSSEADVRHQHLLQDWTKSKSAKKSAARSGLMRISESRGSGGHEEHHPTTTAASHPPSTAVSRKSDTVSSNEHHHSNSNHNHNHNPLRQRASSPLLGNSYRSRQNSLNSLPPPPSKPPAQLPARSTSKLHSFYDMHDPTKAASRSHGDLSPASSATVRKPGRSTNTKRTDHALSDVPELSTATEKHRPPRIDLSMLFPKPRQQAAPLLSPQRMTNSPSPVSVASDASPTKANATTKLTKHPRPRDSVRMMREKQNGQYPSNQTYSRKGKTREWFDGPEGDVSDDEEIPDITYTKKNSISEFVPESGYSPTRNWGEEADASANVANNTAAQPHPQTSPTAECESIGIPSITKSGKTSDPMASSTPASSITVKLQSSLQSWEFDSNNSSRSRVSSVSRKTNNSAFHNSNLNESSVLCLTSSDEEDDGEEPEPPARKQSISSKGDMTDAEAAFGACTLGGLPGRSNTRSRDSMSERNYPRSRNGPPPTTRPRTTSSGRTRQRVSNIPMISEPPEDELPPLPANPTLDIRSPEYLGRNRAPSSNRRSRVIAVTRQEESLLEIMRQRAGGGSTPQPASIFSDNSESTYEDPKKPQPQPSHRPSSRVSHRQNPSTNSSSFTDTSFLRLSTCSPSQTGASNNIVPDPGTSSFMDSDGSASYGPSDTDQRTDNSTASPRLSLIHSDTIPSPSTTSVASPLTPTLPMHKFSPQPPPAEPSPSSQQSENTENRRHSRTRTDSSTAIVLDAPDESGTKQRGRVGSTDLPVWAVGWRDDTAGLGVVH